MGELPSSAKQKYGDSVHNAMRLVDDEGYAFGIPKTDGKPAFMAYVYDPVLMDYIVMTQPVIEAGTVNVVGPLAVTTKANLTPSAPAAASFYKCK